MFDVASHLRMTVRDLLSRASSDELSEWIAYRRIRPFDDGYWQTALICSTVATIAAGGKKTYKIEDFLPRMRRRREQTCEEQLALFDRIVPRAEY